MLIRLVRTDYLSSSDPRLTQIWPPGPYFQKHPWWKDRSNKRFAVEEKTIIKWSPNAKYARPKLLGSSYEKGVTNVRSRYYLQAKMPYKGLHQRRERFLSTMWSFGPSSNRSPGQARTVGVCAHNQCGCTCFNNRLLKTNTKMSVSTSRLNVEFSEGDELYRVGSGLTVGEATLSCLMIGQSL